MSAPVRTTCAYCGVGCGILARPDGKGGLTIEGDPDHPANFGRLCSKGAALGETMSLDERLLAPRVDGKETDWETALDHVAARFAETIARHGPDSVAFYVSGQLLTEDYYVANKLMKGFIGSANIDTNSRLCMASSVAGHKRAFGSDTVPNLYADLDAADLVVLVGSNLAWCHPVLFQRLLAARAERGTRIVCIDPRRTATAEQSDLHLALAPGADVAVFNALLAHLADTGRLDAAFCAHLDGVDAAITSARADAGTDTGLAPADLARFLDLWATTERVVTVYSQGVNQSTSGTDKVNAILNCHLATGRIGKPGCGPLSATGQPNAMGGREVGGLANMLAAHLDIDTPAHRTAVRDFWQAPTLAPRAGLKAVEMFDAVEAGRIKALWIACTNPAVSLPEADRVRDAIAGCDFVVVSDVTDRTDTARLADVLLPATGWGEKDGTVTNSERRISRQRAVLPPPGLARPDWWHFAQVGQRMGWRAAFDYRDAAEVFREHAALSGVAARLGGDFDVSGLGSADYAALAPTIWPAPAGGEGRDRFFADGRFHTPDGRGRMLPLRTRPLARATDAARPFVLNTGRIRDQWHTMTRSALAPRLNRHIAEPFVEVHPADAARLGLRPAGLARVASDHGTALLRVQVSDRVAPGQVFAPLHWTAEQAPTGRIDAVVAGAVDPVSGQPESKATPISLAPADMAWFGFAVSTDCPRPATGYWARARTATGWQVELAGAAEPDDWAAFAQALFGPGEAVTIADPRRGTHRVAICRDGRVAGALFTGREPVALARGYLSEALTEGAAAVLAGQPPADRPDPGPTVCACLNVGVNTILTAIAEDRLMSVEAIGAALGAGTSCGSCRPELAALLAAHALPQAAE
ncbi:molybdopterin-dependent oxidoreductase [Jannaschia marina]|uniref:molybdopterin-dependent oxidoreductase n=1 Tax=Jannaschia marina TaxID=2741674 RepID=UPI0015CBB3E1|nr:nitrate reductase [Jannaschia marina]